MRYGVNVNWAQYQALAPRAAELGLAYV